MRRLCYLSFASLLIDMADFKERKWEGVRPPKDSAGLHFLYNCFIGRAFLRILSSRFISKLVGAFMDSRLSKPLIKSFVSKNKIDLSQFESDDFKCFNDCFCRKIKDGMRPISPDTNALIAPCDGLLSAYKLNGEEVLPIKQSEYTLSSLLKNDALVKQFENGICLVFRLCVTHYHRYCYPITGYKNDNIFIKGKLHTVRPIALRRFPVFTENCREYTLIESKEFGKLLQMEVGAMLVGKIKNLHGAGFVERGAEKGMFLYGGSTVVLLLENNKVEISEDVFVNTESGLETPVYMGECIGFSTKKE